MAHGPIGSAATTSLLGRGLDAWALSTADQGIPIGHDSGNALTRTFVIGGAR
jgi:hypothetical protein